MFLGLSNGLVTSSFAVTGFALASMGMYKWCTNRRADEARGMALAQAGMKALQEKRKREAAEEAEKEEQLRKFEEANRPWYKKIW